MRTARTRVLRTLALRHRRRDPLEPYGASGREPGSGRHPPRARAASPEEGDRVTSVFEQGRLTIGVRPEDHAQGPPVARVEYGDCECPHCIRAFPLVKRIRAAMPDDVLFVFRNFPLTAIHPHALDAARAAEAAGLQDAFWPMHDRLYSYPRRLTRPDLLAHALSLGLDERQFLGGLRVHLRHGPDPRGRPQRRAQRRQRDAHALRERPPARRPARDAHRDRRGRALARSGQRIPAAEDLPGHVLLAASVYPWPSPKSLPE